MVQILQKIDNNTTLVKKTLGAIIFAIVGILIISFVSFFSFNKIGAEIEEIADYQVPINSLITELEKDILQEEILTLELIIESKDIKSEAFKNIQQRIIKLEQETAFTIQKAEGLVYEAIQKNEDLETKNLYTYFYNELKKLEQEQKVFKDDLKQFENNLRTNINISSNKEIVMNDLKTMEKHIIILMEKMEELLKYSTMQAELNEKNAVKSIIIINLIVITFSLLIGILLTKTIKKRFNDLQERLDNFFKYMRREVSNLKEIEIVSNDEISQISKKLNENVEHVHQQIKDDMKVMGETIITLDKVEQGIYTCRIKSNSKNPMVATLRKTINKMLDVLSKDMSQLKNVLEQYSNDDFTNKVTISPKLRADMLSVMESVNNLGDVLNESAKTNLQHGQHLEANSNTMTESVTNLANKANQQASSLEETAAAVEEITSITRNNTDNASKMSKLGKHVKDEVFKGMELANQTSSSMDEINTQVTAISEAITVIDQIAFQTNILSLNAAVEAATAGEAGKGFAVVAQEVRNLASRSADAANEIKAIVETAKNKATIGKNVSDEMIQGYTVLNNSFQETITLIEDVSISSKEQMQGIEQINDTVTMLDRVTQENASEANAVARIAEDVSTMANQLVEDAQNKKTL